MVIIRLARAGAKKRPFYHVVVTDSRCRRDSNAIEPLGYFNPVAAGKEVRLHLNTDRISYWKSVGAQMSDRVKALCHEYEKTTKPSAPEAAPKAKKTKKAVKKPTQDDAAA